MIWLNSRLGLLSLGVLVAFLGCGKTSDHDANVAADGGGAGKAGMAGELNGTIQIDAGGVGNAGSSGSAAGVDGLPTQPAIDCGQAGGDSAGAADANEECASPRSVCTDEGRLAYYSSGVCVAGKCRWTVETLQCPGGCSRGSCVSSTTEK
jgi:hypothetical protein